VGFKGPETFEPAPTATIIHAYNSDGVSLVTLSDEEIYEVVQASGAHLIGKPNEHPRVMVRDRFIAERGIRISQIEQSMAIEESHASYFWEKQEEGKRSYEMATMEVNTCGDSLSPRALATFLDRCDYPELVSFIYFAPTPVLSDLRIDSREALLGECFTEPFDCYSRYNISCHQPVDIPTGKMYTAYLHRKDVDGIVYDLRAAIRRRYADHTMKLQRSDRKQKLMVNSQQEEYLACAFYDCRGAIAKDICNASIREDDALYELEDCFDDVLLSTDTAFVFDHDFDPPGYTGVWVTGGTGYIALHVTPNPVGGTPNFVEFCAYIHPSMWVFHRESLVHVMRPILKLFQPERAEIHYHMASRDITHPGSAQQKFIRKRLVGLGYSHKEFVSYYDDFFGRTFFHLNIEKK
jgi:S-adenosylmethionine/arginine decarboxylase-like enzyme